MGNQGISDSSPSNASDPEYRETIVEAERMIEKNKGHLKSGMKKVKRLTIEIGLRGVEAEEFLVDGKMEETKKVLRKEYVIKHEINELVRLGKHLEWCIEEIEDMLSTRNVEEQMMKYREYLDRLESDRQNIKKNEDEEVEQCKKNIERYIQKRIEIIKKRREGNHSQEENEIDSSLTIAEVQEAWDFVFHQDELIAKSPDSTEMGQYWDDLLD